MTFYTFMMKTYRSDDSPAGDLARDMKSDAATFPRNGKGKFEGWRTIIRDYLMDRGACDNCLATFDECWKEYMKCEKRR